MISNIFHLSLKMLLLKKWRTLFSICGAAFGIGLLVSMLVLYGQMDNALDKQITDRYGEADLMVGFRNSKLLNASQVEHVQKMSGIIKSSRVLVNPQQFSKGNSGRSLGIYYIGIDNSSLAKGKYHFSKDLDPGEVIISEKLAKSLHAKVFDTVDIPFTGGKKQKWKVVEIISNPMGIGVPDIAIFHLDSLQESFGLEGSVNLILLKLDPNVNQRFFAKELKNKIDLELDIDILTETEYVKKNIQSMRIMGYGLGILALITSVLFVLSNFQISIRERVRELAVLRAIGGSPGQSFKLVFTEAIIINTIGTVLGAFLGILLAQLLSSSIAHLLNIPALNAPLNWGTIIFVCLSSWLLLFFISMIPARHTMKILPIQAARESEVEEYHPSKWQKWLSILFGFVGTVLVVIGLQLRNEGNGSMALVGVLGGLLLTIGIFSGTIFLIKPILLGLSPLAEKIGGRESFVAVRNLISQRKQNTLIILVLAVAITLSISVSSLFLTLESEMKKNVYDEYVTDFVVSSSRFMDSTLPYEFKKEIERISGVKAAIPISTWNSAYLKGGEQSEKKVNYLLTDVKGLSEQGLIPLLTTNAQDSIILSKEMAKEIGVQIGDRVLAIKRDYYTHQQESESTLIVAAILDSLPGTVNIWRPVLVDWNNPILRNKESKVSRVLVEIDEKKRPVIMKAFDNLANKFPEMGWADLQMALNSIEREISQRLSILGAVIGVVLIIGAFGIINTLSSNIHAKRREYAILRAIRITPGQLIKMILTQSLLFSCVAIVLGLTTGFLMAYVFAISLNAEIITPWKTLIGTIAVVVALSFAVSLPLAYRLGRKSVITALRIE